MHAEYWVDRWVNGNTGWHQTAPHPFLTRHGPRLWTGGAAHAPHVFVPLCGASVDMLWLRRQGATVVGIDVAGDAFRRFFADSALVPVVERSGRCERWTADGIELLGGDFFAADASVFGRFDAVYDRAALFALPPELRRRYALRMIELCRPGTAMLLITLEYPQHETDGPPFAVLEAEVHALYDAAFAIEPLERADVYADNPRLQAKGVTAIEECAFALVRRGA